MSRRTNGWAGLEPVQFKAILESVSEEKESQNRVSSNEQPGTGWLYVDVRSHGTWTCLAFRRGVLISSDTGRTKDAAYLGVCQKMQSMGYEFPWLTVEAS